MAATIKKRQRLCMAQLHLQLGCISIMVIKFAKPNKNIDTDVTLANFRDSAFPVYCVALRQIQIETRKL